MIGQEDEYSMKSNSDIHSRQRSAYVLAGIAVLAWSTVATAFKLALEDLTPSQLLFYVAFFAIAILHILVRLSGKEQEMARYTAAQFWRSGVMGALTPFVYYTILFLAYDLLPAQEAMVLNYTWPLVLVCLSVVLLGQKPTKMAMLGLIICFVGIIVIATNGALLSFQFHSPLGTFLALVSTLIWSLFWIYNVKDSRDEVCKLYLSTLFSFPLITIYMLVVDGLPPISWSAILLALYIGAFEIAITFVLWLKALAMSPSTAKVSGVIYFAPILSLLWIALILGEAITASTVAGLVLVLAGNVLKER